MTDMGKEITNFKMTELGPLPKEWEVVRLREINAYQKKTINPSDFPEEIFEYYSIPAYQEGKEPIFEKGKNIRSQKFLLKNGIVLFGKLNPRVEKVWFVESGSNYRLIGSTEWIPIEASERVDPVFLYYLMWSEYVMPKAKKMVSGSTPSRQRIDLQKFFRIKIPLPPLPEQKAIARVLKAIQDAIEATERVIAAAKELKKSLMRHLFTYGPVPVSEAPCLRLKQTEIGPIPEDWEVVRLGDLNFDISDGNYSSKYPRQSDFVQKGIPFIRAINIQDGKIVWKDMKYITTEKHNELQKGHLKKDDILITTRGDIGKVAIVSDEFVGCNINAQIVRINTSNTQIYSRFLFYNFIFFNKDLRSLATGSTLKQLPISRLLHFKFPLPPLSVQQKIVQILKAVDDKIEAEEKKKEALQALFKTMLHHLMTGKIRVKY